jgi:hypothetical protein
MAKNKDKDSDVLDMTIAYRFASVVIFLIILIVMAIFIINTLCANGGK